MALSDKDKKLANQIDWERRKAREAANPELAKRKKARVARWYQENKEKKKLYQRKLRRRNKMTTEERIKEKIKEIETKALQLESAMINNNSGEDNISNVALYEAYNSFICMIGHKLDKCKTEEDFIKLEEDLEENK